MVNEGKILHSGFAGSEPGHPLFVSFSLHAPGHVKTDGEGLCMEPSWWAACAKWRDMGEREATELRAGAETARMACIKLTLELRKARFCGGSIASALTMLEALSPKMDRDVKSAEIVARALRRTRREEESNKRHEWKKKEGLLP